MGIPSESFGFEKKPKKYKLFDDVDDNDSSNLNKFVLINDDFALLLTPFLHGKQYDEKDEARLACRLAEAIKDSNEALAISHTIEQEVADAFEDFDRVSLYLIKVDKQVDDLFRSIPYIPVHLARIIKVTMEKLASFKQTAAEVNEYVHQNISVYLERKRLLEYFGINNKITRLLENATINLNTTMSAYYKAEEILMDSLKILNKIQAVGDSIRLFQSLVWSKLEAIGALQEYLKKAKELSIDIKTNANNKCRLPYVQDRANLCEASLDMVFLSFEDIEVNIQDGMKVFEDNSMDTNTIEDSLQIVQKNCEDILVSIGKNIGQLQSVKDKAEEAGTMCLVDVSLSNNPFNVYADTDTKSNTDIYNNDTILSLPSYKDSNNSFYNNSNTIINSPITIDSTKNESKPTLETNIFKNELDLDMGLSSTQFVSDNSFKSNNVLQNKRTSNIDIMNDDMNNDIKGVGFSSVNNTNSSSNQRKSVSIRKSLITKNPEDDYNYVLIEYNELLDSLNFNASGNQTDSHSTDPPLPSPQPPSISSPSKMIGGIEPDLKLAMDKLNKELKWRHENARVDSNLPKDIDHVDSPALSTLSKKEDKPHRKTVVVEDDTLPEDWIKKYSEKDNRHYYVNKSTKKRQWNHPSSSRRGSY